jgi:hypothetical protein
MTSYTLAILFYALKPIVKKLLSIENVIFHSFALSEALSEKNQSQEVALNKLSDYETACSLLALMVLNRKIFKN